MKKFAVIVLMSVLTACTTVPKGPEQTVYAAHGSYAAGLTIALQYKSLPTCGDTTSDLCKDPEKLKQLQEADDEAYRALATAQSIVRMGPSPEATGAASAAERAVAEFRKQTATVKVK